MLKPKAKYRLTAVYASGRKQTTTATNLHTLSYMLEVALACDMAAVKTITIENLQPEEYHDRILQRL
jgi:hypothetical protein